MPNFAQALKAEIVRLSRKEIKSSTSSLRGSAVFLKKTVAALKRKVATLESENKRLSSYYKTVQERQPDVSPEEAKKARISSKGILKLRTKLGLSQDAFARLLGVTSQAVYTMEHKSGRLRLRPATLAHLLSVRDMGKREAKARLEEMGNKKKK